MTRCFGGMKGIVGITIALAIFVAARLLPQLSGLSAIGQAVLGIVIAGVVLWVTEATPLGVTALLMLVLLGTVASAGGSETFVGFASPVVFFLIGAVALGTAVETSGRTSNHGCRGAWCSLSERCYRWPSNDLCGNGRLAGPESCHASQVIAGDATSARD
jgi:Sodium:sulfate symporter transmembrane region